MPIRESFLPRPNHDCVHAPFVRFSRRQLSVNSSVVSGAVGASHSAGRSHRGYAIDADARARADEPPPRVDRSRRRRSRGRRFDRAPSREGKSVDCGEESGHGDGRAASARAAGQGQGRAHPDVTGRARALHDALHDRVRHRARLRARGEPRAGPSGRHGERLFVVVGARLHHPATRRATSARRAAGRPPREGARGPRRARGGARGEGGEAPGGGFEDGARRMREK